MKVFVLLVVTLSSACKVSESRTPVNTMILDDVLITCDIKDPGTRVAGHLSLSHGAKLRKSPCYKWLKVLHVARPLLAVHNGFHV